MNIPTTKWYFEKHDLWVGVYWKKLYYNYYDQRRYWLVLWICFVPCLPLRVVIRGISR